MRCRKSFMDNPQYRLKSDWLYSFISPALWPLASKLNFVGKSRIPILISIASAVGWKDHLGIAIRCSIVVGGTISGDSAGPDSAGPATNVSTGRVLLVPAAAKEATGAADDCISNSSCTGRTPNFGNGTMSSGNTPVKTGNGMHYSFTGGPLWQGFPVL